MGGSLNTLRGILVGGAALAVIVGAIYQLWVVVIVLGIGIVAHGLLWWYLYRQQRRDADRPGAGGPVAAPPGDARS